MSKIDYQALREAAEKATKGKWAVEFDDEIYSTDGINHEQIAMVFSENESRDAEFIAAANPATVLALLDEINALEETRINDVCRIAELTKQLELAKSKLNEQREYYEGVISDGSKRIAELEKIATDYALKFQKAQDALKYAVLLRKSGQEAREIKPAKGEVLVVVSGFTGCGKSAIAGEIEIAMKSIGVPVKWTNGDAEKRMTGADWLTAIEMYKPTVRIVEVNVPRAAGIRIKGGA
ncbi:TPA: ead/Ea22-like family protein [Escherichia coli]|nr:ead/Ea22-like family protein [Escherichia coli]HCO2260563.1 ead/Ea22-like family protein [Escherichia coli]HCW2864116.1 ead/Ea22-like family protein [Escherichia coli]HCW2896682.1 ead/Ea22-like family protein [Escherichia coli]HCW3034254.1 ead/Ea22-like family protein [Escherichia coli]